MKKLLLIFLLFLGVEKVSGFNSGLNWELTYIYAAFILVVLLIAGTDTVLKYVYKKLKEREERFNEHEVSEQFDE